MFTCYSLVSFCEPAFSGKINKFPFKILNMYEIKTTYLYFMEIPVNDTVTIVHRWSSTL